MKLWFLPIYVYLLIGGFFALKPRVVFLPIGFIIPLVLLGLQASLILALTHEQQLMALAVFLAGLGLGGTYLRFEVLSVLPGKTPLVPSHKFVVDGEKVTLCLVAGIGLVKTVASYVAATMPVYAGQAVLAGTLVGVLVPGIFLGRALFLASRA